MASSTSSLVEQYRRHRQGGEGQLGPVVNESFQAIDERPSSRHVEQK